MTDVLLVTSTDLPDGEAGGDRLVAELERRDVSARWVAWDDPDADWSAATVVAVRSTWDYEDRLEEFLAWSRTVGPALLNGAEVFAWNTDKRYLLALQDAGLPVVPTRPAETADEVAECVRHFGVAVAKPVVGAGGRGVVVLTDPDQAEQLTEGGPWIVQPLVESVRTEGETSVFVLGGQVCGQANKVPAGGEIRVHEAYGGATHAVPVSEEHAALALRAVRLSEELLATELAYARADLMRLDDGSLALGELEVTEPGLYLEECPGNAAAFASVVEARAAGR